MTQKYDFNKNLVNLINLYFEIFSFALFENMTNKNLFYFINLYLGIFNIKNLRDFLMRRKYDFNKNLFYLIKFYLEIFNIKKEIF